MSAGTHMLNSMTMHDQVKLAAHHNSTLLELCRQCTSLTCKCIHRQTQIATTYDKVYPWNVIHITCYEALSDRGVSAHVSCLTYGATVQMRTMTARLCRDAAQDRTSIIWYMHEAHAKDTGSTIVSMFQPPFHSDELRIKILVSASF